jgi:PAS domain S-box-containing protein
MKIKSLISNGALKVALVFFVLSFFWILFSDRLLLLVTKDEYKLTTLQTYKGWFYVLVAAITIYYLVNREINKKNSLLKIVNKKNEWYNLLLSNIPGIEVLLFNKSPGYIMAHGNNILLTDRMLANKNIDEKLLFYIHSNSTKFKELKSRILSGEKFHYDTVTAIHNIDIIGQPIVDDDSNIIAGLLVIHDTTHHKKILQELNEEKLNYETLFKEYHSINLELKKSYEKQQEDLKLINASKERYEAFLTQTTEAVYRIDLSEKVTITLPEALQIGIILKSGYLAECNPVFLALYGLSNITDLQGMKISEINAVNSDKHFNKLIHELVTHKYTLRNFETREGNQQGSERYFLNNLIGIVENNNLSRLWGIKTEITKQKKYEQELITAKQIAEKSDQLKSAFLANMSHEIRTPLNGIVGFSELLSQNELDADQKKKYISIVKTSNNQLLRVIDDILDVSRLETGQLSVSKELFHLNILINELESYVRQEIAKRVKKLSISVQKSLSDTSDMLYSDKQRLYQVLSNLLNNAVKFTEKGSIEFGYSLLSNTKLEFYVKDSGIGIPVSEHESVFKQFKQVEEYTSRKYGGTGLGLSICKGIVELLGGSISVESEPEKGSTFRFDLPFVQEKV